MADANSYYPQEPKRIVQRDEMQDTGILGSVRSALCDLTAVGLLAACL
jgi:hypothetical protein